jgi:hypothetical protein
MSSFYARVGFSETLRQTLIYASGNEFPMVVMRMPLS